MGKLLINEALANPMPLNFLRILLESSTTFTPSLPVLKRIAKSSESESRSGPYFSSFSLDLSTFEVCFVLWQRSQRKVNDFFAVCTCSMSAVSSTFGIFEYFFGNG
ncbi:MAG: hypothetical protein G01um101448_1212 [Parcubacteria group bacterium Gr01-1014_48]|nr:MAG: hypothetical protein G01um101448_1212 [Parcubacteria group bacterium Gr01-1014_48]TSD00706.1 MAG: hypothetical protein Greene101415_706 [Parcubacteria group bacterium Greene1014_15]